MSPTLLKFLTLKGEPGSDQDFVLTHIAFDAMPGHWNGHFPGWNHRQTGEFSNTGVM